MSLVTKGVELKAGLWSMVDQGVVSAGNFLTAIFVARALPPTEYGVYALIFAVMLLMVFLHGAFIVYGLSLHGAAGTEATLNPLVGASMVLTTGLGIVLGAVTSGVAAMLHRTRLVPWILLAVLFWQLQETTRRALMSRLRHRQAVWGDAVSYLGQAACVAFFLITRHLTLASAFGAMFLTSALGWMLQMAQLKLAPWDFRGAMCVLPKFWGVARWPLLGTVTQAFMGQALLWLLAFAGMARVASFQSVLNVLRVTNPVMFAMGSVLLPTIAARQRNRDAGVRSALRYGVLGALVLVPYCAMIFTFPGAMLRLLYGSASAYAALDLELRVLVLGCGFVYVEHILGMYFYGLSRGDVVLRCESVGAATAVFGGLLLVKSAGVLGATIAYDLTFAASTAAFIWFWRADTSGGSVEAARPHPAPVNNRTVEDGAGVGGQLVHGDYD